MAETYPNKRLREHFHCEICPEYGSLPLMTECGECNQSLFVMCTHDGFHDGRYICQTCAERLSAQFTVCTFHGKIMAYYCVNCERGVCADCLIRSSGHDGHTFEQLEKLYQKRMELVTKKLDELTAAFKSRDEDNKRVSRNLEMITANEMELVAEVDALAEAAKADIRRSVRERKELLLAKLRQPIKKELYRQDWEKRINSLSKTEFIQKHAETLGQISQHMPPAIEAAHELVECHNIKCSLIPKLIMLPLFIEDICKKKYPVSFMMFDASGFAWSLTAYIEQKFSLQFTPKNKRQEIYKHRVVIEILHDDFMRTINHSFVIQRSDQKMELADMKFLKENGYISTEGHNMLMMRIAIRPVSIVVENYLHIDENNKFRHGVDEEVADLREQVTQLKLRSSSNFFLPLETLVNEGDFVLSHPLMDSQGIEWCLRLKRNNRKLRNKGLKACLGAYIVQLSGPKSKCKFYVTLYNIDPDKHVRMVGEEMYELEQLTYGQYSFVDVDQLTEEVGFVNDGKARFEFGITPMIDDPSALEDESPPVPNNGTSEDFLRCRHLFGTFG